MQIFYFYLIEKKQHSSIHLNVIFKMSMTHHYKLKLKSEEGLEVKRKRPLFLQDLTGRAF